MRGAWTLLVVLTLGGCGIVSGLDELGVGDATSDSSIAETSADANANDVSSSEGSVDASTDVADASTQPTIACGGNQVCSINAGQVCCAPPDGGPATCDKACFSSTYLELACDDPSDCTDASAPVCCFGSGVTSTTPLAKCRDLLSCGAILCTLGGKTQTCKSNTACVAYDAGPFSISVGHCQ